MKRFHRRVIQRGLIDNVGGTEIKNYITITHRTVENNVID